MTVTNFWFSAKISSQLTRMIPSQSYQFIISGLIQIRKGKKDSKTMRTYDLDSNFNNIEHELQITSHPQSITII